MATTTFEIFPSIGIARVGTSSKFFIGPEADTAPDLRRRDDDGNLLRQAARFRIFRCEREAGKLTKATEVTSAEATIEWGVHLVNRKAAAPKFAESGQRNNATGDDVADKDLIINPEIKHIKNGGAAVPLDGGKFKNHPVSLGRIEIEPSGRLLVLGGDGHSAAFPAATLPVDANFANNDNWHDTMGDGPVTATVKIGNETPPVTGAWVIVAPPDFAPQIQNIITLHDALTDLAIENKVLPEPPVIFFDRHVRPILERAMSMQWVNRQARRGYDADGTDTGGHGPSSGGEFDLDALGNDSVPDGTRRSIFKLLRDPVTGGFPLGVPNALRMMPRLNDSKDSGQVLPLTKQQYRAMREWAANNFKTTDPAGPTSELLPDALTRVALEAAVGGGFFPGIEAGSILLDAKRYMKGEAYRLSHTAVKPGMITAQNALPWQADFYACQWEQAPNGTGKRLGWWPAQRPDDVLVTADGRPVPWIQGITDSFQGMVDGWHKLGFVKEDPANAGVFIEFDRVLQPRPDPHHLMPAMQRYDVAVIGGGPAGAAAAIMLARSGRSVALFERSHYDQRRVGEVVPPAIARTLHELQARHLLDEPCHLRTSGATTAWGAAEPSQTDYLFTPPGYGWVLDRARFDGGLARIAATAGAHVACGHRVLACHADSRSGWELAIQGPEGLRRVEAGFLLKATGRGAVVQGLDSTRTAPDKLVAILHYATRATPPTGEMTRLRLESTEHGWWYSTPLPHACALFGHITDADSFAGNSKERLRLWQERLRETVLISDPAMSDPHELHCVAASTSRACKAAGPGWMAVGDAAVSTDPLSGQGVFQALHSGIDAAALMLQSQVQSSIQAHHEMSVQQSYEEALDNAHRYYRLEMRWKRSRFWDRRRALYAAT